jgi:hypothetical protein
VGLKRPRARRRLARGSGSLERGGDSPGGGDSPERGGGQALERGRDFVVRRLALERGGGLPEGYRGQLLDGLLQRFGLWALLCLGSRP